MPHRPHLPRRALLLGALIASVAACRDQAPEPPPPAAEFLVTAGDSSYWVRTGAAVDGGIEVRRAPILLARLDGRFHELYVTEEDYSFYDALFLSQTVWRRDLLSGDSAVVYGDATIPHLALAYARAHPGAEPLAEEETGADEPTVSATLDVSFGAALGPYLGVESYADVHRERGPEQHRLRRAVVDLRSGTALTLAALVGDSVERRVLVTARAAFGAARDSVLAARADGGRRAAAALSRFAFDEHSFALVADGAAPRVVFFVPGAGEDADGFALPLAPIALPAGRWWREAGATLPHEEPNTTRAEQVVDVRRASRGRGDQDDARRVARWSRGGVDLLARPVATTPASRGASDGATSLVLRDARAHEWTLTTLGAPAERVYWLDRPALDPEARAALARAFRDAALYDGRFSLASHAPRAGARRGHRALVRRARGIVGATGVASLRPVAVRR